MPYIKSQMQYDDGDYYKWNALADHDNPYYRNGSDHTLLNRTEGYEVLYFLNHLVAKWNELTDAPATYRHLEWMIRYSIPGNIRSHKKIEEYIIGHINAVF